MQESEYEQECRTDFNQSSDTVYDTDTRQQCSNKYEHMSRSARYSISNRAV